MCDVINLESPDVGLVRFTIHVSRQKSAINGYGPMIVHGIWNTYCRALHVLSDGVRNRVIYDVDIMLRGETC